MSNYSRIYHHIATVFPKASIHVVDGDNLIKHPVIEMKKLEKYLGLKNFYERRHFYYTLENGGELPCFSVPERRCMGFDKGLDHPPLKRETVKYMKRKLGQMVENFGRETGVKINLL